MILPLKIRAGSWWLVRRLRLCPVTLPIVRKPRGISPPVDICYGEGARSTPGGGEDDGFGRNARGGEDGGGFAHRVGGRRARIGGRRTDELWGHGCRSHPLRLPARGPRQLHDDDVAHVRRPKGLAARISDGAALARQDTRRGLRGVRDGGRQDRPHRARDRARRSLGRGTAPQAVGDRGQVPGAPDDADRGAGEERPGELERFSYWAVL